MGEEEDDDDDGDDGDDDREDGSELEEIRSKYLEKNKWKLKIENCILM